MIKVIKRIPEILSISCILEVSSYKPGNVSRYLDFEDTSFEEFLISSISIYRSVEKLVEKTYRVLSKDMPLSKIHLGYYIKDAILNTKRYVKSNTNLGIIMLTFPLVASSVYSILKDDLENIFINATRILRETTYKDTIYLYEAIKISGANLPRVKDLDVFDKKSHEKIIREKINMYEIMKRTWKYDLIAREYVNGYKITRECFEMISDFIRKGYGLLSAIQKSYIFLLSKYEDSHIAKLRGLEEARLVKEYARKLIDGEINLEEFENFLTENKLNPGATADIITAATFSFLFINYAKENNRKGVEIRFKY